MISFSFLIEFLIFGVSFDLLILFFLVVVFLRLILISKAFMPSLSEAKSLDKVSILIGLKFIIFPLESKVNLFESIIFNLFSLFSAFSLLLIVILLIITFFFSSFSFLIFSSSISFLNSSTSGGKYLSKSNSFSIPGISLKFIANIGCFFEFLFIIKLFSFLLSLSISVFKSF